MKGFKDSSKMRSGFSFPSSAGFTGSTGKVQNISYTRKTPHRHAVAKADGGKVLPRRNETRGALGALSQEIRKTVMPRFDPMKTRDRMVEEGVMRKAEGGRVVDSGLQGRSPASSALDQESGSQSALRPGFRKGGCVPRFAKGGRIPDHKVAAIAKKEISKHVAYPAPQGHKGMGNLLKKDK